MKQGFFLAVFLISLVIPCNAQITGLQLGNKAPEIAMQNPEGVLLNLKEWQGKLVLIDFWASWCAPCRKSNKKLAALYRQYMNKPIGKAQGFEIFSISLDHQINAWKYAISNDELIWKGHVSDLKGWENEAAKRYQIEAIPFNILIDEKGIIIGKNLSEMELMLLLKERQEQSAN